MLIRLTNLPGSSWLTMLRRWTVQPVRLVMGTSAAAVRTPFPNWWVGGGGSIFIVVGAVMIFAEVGGGLSAFILGAACCVFGAWGVLRAARVRVSVGGGQVVYWSEFQRRTLPDDRVASISVDRAPHLLPWHCVWIQLDTGALIPVGSVQVLGRGGGSAHRRLVDAVAQLEDRRRGFSPASQQVAD